jgi:signal peptidase I
MALEEGQGQAESARYGTTTAEKRSIPFGRILLGTLLVSAILFFGLGFRFAFSHGDSMEPSYHSGSLIIKREVEPTSLKVGDVISFYAPWADGYVMHRIAGIRTRDGQLWFRTKGDNNRVEDPGEVTFQDEDPQKLVLALPDGLEAAIAIAGGILGLLAIKVISDSIIESD